MVKTHNVRSEPCGQRARGVCPQPRFRLSSSEKKCVGDTNFTKRFWYIEMGTEYQGVGSRESLCSAMLNAKNAETEYSKNSPYIVVRQVYTGFCGA